MKKSSILFFTLLSMMCFSQTKLISHKSHSGSDETFALAVEKDLFDIEDSNFGEIQMDIKDYVKLDSVIYLSKDKVVRVTSEYTQRYYRQSQEKCSKDEQTRIIKDTIIIKPKSSRKGLTEIEVKKNLDSLNIYNNNLNETIYKGFDKKSKQQKNKKKQLGFPVIKGFNDFPNSSLLISLVGLLSVIVYYITSKIRFSKTVFTN